MVVGLVERRELGEYPDLSQDLDFGIDKRVG